MLEFSRRKSFIASTGLSFVRALHNTVRIRKLFLLHRSFLHPMSCHFSHTLSAIRGGQILMLSAYFTPAFRKRIVKMLGNAFHWSPLTLHHEKDLALLAHSKSSTPLNLLMLLQIIPQNFSELLIICTILGYLSVGCFYPISLSTYFYDYCYGCGCVYSYLIATFTARLRLRQFADFQLHFNFVIKKPDSPIL